MIKRRFYRLEHADGVVASDSSSSSSDSELEAEAPEETEAEDAAAAARVRDRHEALSSSSGYESEDSSANEVDVDSSGLITNDDEIGTGPDGQSVIRRHSSSKSDAEKDATGSDVGCILKHKSVFKCRLCPRIVCLTEETLKRHLKSKRHARSEKLLSEGRLKFMLNNNGEIEEEGETHAERHARCVAATPISSDLRKKQKGRQRQNKRLKKKMGNDSKLDKARQSTKNPVKKRRKNEK
ncbi:hypothetical protein U1Q18_012098 [Sarracenia purpurea var. burkii]